MARHKGPSLEDQIVEKTIVTVKQYIQDGCPAKLLRIPIMTNREGLQYLEISSEEAAAPGVNIIKLIRRAWRARAGVLEFH